MYEKNRIADLSGAIRRIVQSGSHWCNTVVILFIQSAGMPRGDSKIKGGTQFSPFILV